MSNHNGNSIKQVLLQLISNVFEQSGNKPLNHRQVAAQLNIIDPASKATILEILEDETVNGIFLEVGKGKYKLHEVKAFLTGKISMANDGSAFLIPDDEFEKDIYIGPRKLRTALHGDLVKLHVYESSKGKRKEGEVVEILQRAKMEFTGIVKLSQHFAFFIPDDRKMLHDIFIPLEDLNGAKNGMKALAKIVDWPSGAKNPVGIIKNILGKQGENNTEMNAILAEYGFPLTFPAEVEKEAESISTAITKEEIAKRRDFREVTTFTIDPFDAKDFDDAISFKTLENGNYEVGVHIADVSHYLIPDSALDKEAYERGTSVYLVDRVIPMLPEVLSNGLCSLRPKEEKYCFSAVFELDKEANIHSQWFGKTVIYSDKRFAYEDVQEIIEAKKGEFSKEILTLNALAYKLRERKFKHGAISFESTEVKFKLDERGKPIGVYVKERKDAHKLIEDFMLLANKKVAEYIAKKGKGKHKYTFVYRAHDTPKPESLKAFAEFAAKFGHKISTKTDRETARSLNKLMADVEGTKEQNVLTSLAIRSMAKAIYTTKSSSHYGLAFDFYTHFTSPIRRYPDVMVHRLLEHYLNGGDNVSAEHYEKMCQHASQMEKKAADAERASIKYKQAEYLQDNIGQNYQGIISGLTEWGMYVEIEENKCEGMIRLRDISDDFYVLDEKNYCIIGQKKKKKYQLGDEVKIKVKRVDLAKRQIDFILMS
ncbi:ribonuclease R [Pedobacter sp. SD-b]|uniref:Ribonuclease R n=1 Tax=Pedobacter segetis TaxID=2793069 RepID=A0ABS1BHM8_9SPHI|nr:ribonuclease R [Pedobacter segetis]MBK0382364.1 ribonuclease R [Pedobacter segetis]